MEANREYWRAVSVFTNYEVSSVGRVRNSGTGRVLKPSAGGGGYPHVVLNKDGKQRTRNIHQLVAEAFIENPEDKRCIDHIDSNKKNNCVENLRRATHSQNGMNQKIRTNTSSIYKGVYHHKPTKKWMSYIRINGKLKNLGLFENEKEAARKYNEAALEHFGEFAKLNVIED